MKFLRPISAVFVLFGATVSAQNIPDAGALMRQNEQSIRQDLMQRNALRRKSFPPEMQMVDTTRVTPKNIRFLGAKLLPGDELQAVAKPYLDRSLDSHELEHLTNDQPQICHGVVGCQHQNGNGVQNHLIHNNRNHRNFQDRFDELHQIFGGENIFHVGDNVEFFS